MWGRASCVRSSTRLEPGGLLWSVGTLCALTVLTTRAGAQDPLVVQKFAIQPSALALTGDVRPAQYVGVLGRRAAWLGVETGEAELWVHPLKLATDFRLDFRIPDYVEPVRGADVARTVTVRPELTTITYTHATFTVQQHILAPLDDPGILVFLDVNTFRPLEVIVSFQTVFQYAWPGAFGGQYTFWDDNAKVFVLSESLRERNAVIGSPWPGRASTHPAHALPDAPNTLIIPVDPSRAAREFLPIVVTAAVAPRDTVLAQYRHLLAEAHERYREKRRHVERLLGQTTALDTPDSLLDRAFAWSNINLDESFSCNPDLGCGLVAGWGPSGNSTRPGFGWFFGGDAAINTFAMTAIGQWREVASALRFLARYQRDDGKIPHEIAQSAGRIPWFTAFPYTYYHADTTPYWIVAVWRYWRASADHDLLQDLWPAVRRAFAWCLTTETDGDGIIENTTGGLGAIEVGSIGADIHQDIYLAAVWTMALQAVHEMATALGEPSLAREAAFLRNTASTTLNQAYWRQDEQHHAFGILRDGDTNDNLTVWPATAAAFALLDPARAESTLIKLATDSISADWGARMLSTGSPLYEPMQYNSGTVWPFVTGFVSWGQYTYRRSWAGFPLIDALKQMTFHWARGRHPELLSGQYYRPLDTAVPQQFFATSMLITPLVSGLLGWDPDAPRRRASLAPQLPPHWDALRVERLRSGTTAFAAAVRRGPGVFSTTVTPSAPGDTVTVIAPVPPGARDVRIRTEFAGAATVDSAPDGATSVRVTRALTSPAPLSVEVSWIGGLAVEPPLVQLRPGQESNGLRVVDFGTEPGGWRLTVDGRAGHVYDVRLHGEALSAIEGATLVGREQSVSTIRLVVPGESGRVTSAIRLHR